MQTLLTTENVSPKDSFRIWRDSICDRFGTFDIEKNVDGPFSAQLEGSLLGPIQATRLSQRAVTYKLTSDQIRKSENGDYVLVCLMVKGAALIQQNGRDCIHRTGEIVLLDASPLCVKTSDLSDTITFRILRKKFEDTLGSVKSYTALNSPLSYPLMDLSSKFMLEVINKQSELSFESSRRMVSICTDLLVSAFAERMAVNAPRSNTSVLTLQRAKSYIDENLHKPSLEPMEIAAASGVSLRRLQELFQEQDQHVSGWLWKRRLEVAALRLADPACNHMSVQTIGFGCGFATQSHFTNRFKKFYGLPPGVFRRNSSFSFLP